MPRRKLKKKGKDAGQRAKKLSKKSSKMMKGRARYAQQKASLSSKIANQVAKEPPYAKGKFIGGLIAFGCGLGGAVLSMFVDSYYKKEEYDMTRDIVSEVNRLHGQDKDKLEIISDEGQIV